MATEEPQQIDSNTVNIRPRNVYGLRTDILGNIHFNLQQEVIYPVEGVIAIHDYVEKTQRFMPFTDDATPYAMKINPTRKILAVLEDVGKQTQVSIYDLATMKKRRCIPVPKYENQGSIVQMQFVHDSKAIVLLTKYPNEIVFMLLLDVANIIYECRPTLSFNRGNVHCLACHPTDTNIIAVGGDSILLFMCKSEKGFQITQNFKIDFHVTSMVYTYADLFWVGTSLNELIAIEKNEIKFRCKANSVEIIDLHVEPETFGKDTENRFLFAETLYNSRVECLTNFTHGLAFVIYNRVYVFDRTYKYKFERKTVLMIPVQYYPDNLYQIQNIDIDHKEETVMVTAKHSQIYIGVLIVPETLKTKFLEFEPLGLLLHIDDILYASICAWKPIIMTASRDQTVRIWNYQTETTELVRKFQMDVKIAELDPMGLAAVIAFTDQIRIAQIFMEDFNVIKTYHFPRCKSISFSNKGHLLAIGYDNQIAITSTSRLEVVTQLQGHTGIVLCTCWTFNDKFLLSGGIDGVLYQWDAMTGELIQEIVQNGVAFRSICCTNNKDFSIYAAASNGIMYEYQGSNIVREVSIPSRQKCGLVNMCLSTSNLVMFITNEIGDFFNVTLPFMDSATNGITNYPFFVSQINKVLFTYDGLLLIAISKAGTLTIWNMDNVEGKVAPIDPDLLRSQEVLISRSLLKEKNEKIANLERQLMQQVEDFQFQVSQNEIMDGQQLAEVHRDYCNALDELKEKNKETKVRHEDDIEGMRIKIINMKEEHQAVVKKHSDQYSERLLVEYKKFSDLRENMLELRENYEEKLKKSTITLEDTIEDLESDYKKQLDERRQTIRELLKEMSDKKVEFMEFCHQVEQEHDRNLVELELKYENKLNIERNETKTWHTRTSVLQKKYEFHNEELQNMMLDLEKLQEEHYKSQANIAKLNHDMEDLQTNITDRDVAINTKEQRIQDLKIKNVELDKYKNVLTYKIHELKEQIEPREYQIIDKSKHILEMDGELTGLKQNNMQLDLQLKELKDKYISNVTELKIEEHRYKATRECIQNLSTEIYHLAAKLHKPTEMQFAIKEMFNRHATDSELKRFVSMDPEVRDEFQRQRVLIERVLAIYRNRGGVNMLENKYKKLLKEQKTLLEEVELQRAENKKLTVRVQEYMNKKAKERNVYKKHNEDEDTNQSSSARITIVKTD